MFKVCTSLSVKKLNLDFVSQSTGNDRQKDDSLRQPARTTVQVLIKKRRFLLCLIDSSILERVVDLIEKDPVNNC